MLLCLVITLTFDSSPIKGEGVLLVGLDLVTRVTRRPVDSRLRENDGAGVGVDLHDWDDALHRYHPHL